ncbi:hypothetical protein KL86DPRO_11757 [uncultured delta proteobacterium]|uniref:YcxB-like protein domain-containing protein n=1 Tax=uncultured delta proteobacterium TaxID=34034 RepID=A0A212JLI2_9DELT|nr:hypothetical protein KL86DPRO_11757 [uncultured delta proteobacterium]
MHPDSRFPEDMRTFIVTRRHVFLASLPSLARLFLGALAGIILFDCYTVCRDYGPDLILEHFGSWIPALLTSLWPMYCLFAGLCAFLYWCAGKQKVVGIPVRYGFDDTGVYIDDFYGSSYCRWELFNSTREGREFILLNDGARKILWPKAVWSDAELAAQRTLIREKVSPKRVCEP